MWEWMAAYSLAACRPALFRLMEPMGGKNERRLDASGALDAVGVDMQTGCQKLKAHCGVSAALCGAT